MELPSEQMEKAHITAMMILDFLIFIMRHAMNAWMGVDIAT